ncbi:MAG: hypothetical protein ACXABO_14100 [Promethearchaeota archaeon]|jgi:hypothetical protein
MGSPHNGKRNGWRYNDNSLKNNIENNSFIKNIRKKLMAEKLKKHLNH